MPGLPALAAGRVDCVGSRPKKIGTKKTPFAAGAAKGVLSNQVDSWIDQMVPGAYDGDMKCRGAGR